MMRRAMLIGLCVLAGIAAVQAATIERVQILRAGLWLTGTNGQLAFSRAPDVISARVGTVFGVEWRPTGRASDSSATLKIRWLYPAPGLPHPVTRARRTSDEFDYAVTPGTREITVIELNSEAMLLAGKWTLEIGDATRVLARYEFTLAP
jgi:hypothetical protein